MNHLYLPGKVYFKNGSTGVALRELTEVYKLKRAFIVTSAASYAGGAVSKVNTILEKLKMRTAEFYGVGDPVALSDIEAARPKLAEFDPEVIVGLGNSSVMSAAKLIRKAAEESGKKVLLVLIPTSFADGAQNTPFAEVLTDDGFEVINEFGFIPDMSITDAGFVQKYPSCWVRNDASGLLKKVLAAYMNPDCNEYPEGFLREAARSILLYTEDAAAGNITALEKLHNASSLAGNAFGNVYDSYDPENLPEVPKEAALSAEENERMTLLAAYAGYKNTKAFLKACREICK